MDFAFADIPTIMSVLVLAVFLLLVGSFYLWKKKLSNKHAVLMLILAIALAGNIVIMMMPV